MVHEGKKALIKMLEMEENADKPAAVAFWDLPLIQAILFFFSKLPFSEVSFFKVCLVWVFFWIEPSALHNAVW